MKLLIAGGGTGGHLFPGLAVAEMWKAEGNEVVFVGTPRGLEKDLVPRFGHKLELMTVSPIKGNKIVARLRAFKNLPSSFFQALKILKKEKPDVVLGIGGYASGPCVLAASLKRIPTGVIEQNSIPGLTNKVLGKFVKRVFITFENAKKFFAEKKVRVTGNPVLKERLPSSIVRSFDRSIAEKASSELSHDRTIERSNLLIMGGSQGAHRVNEIFLEAYALIREKIPHLSICHQTGKNDFEPVKAKYGTSQNVTVAPFFDKMQDWYAKTSLVICRSGASSLTELALWGLPSILIPYPYAADDHQKFNAKEFEDKGAAFLFDEKDLTAEKLAEAIVSILQNNQKYLEMKKAALGLSKPLATNAVVGELKNISGLS